MKKTFLFLTVLLSLSLVFGFAAVNKADKGNPERSFRQAFMERSPGMFDVNAYVKKQQETYGWLMAEAAPLSADSIITIPVSKEDLFGIENYQCENCGGIKSVTQKVRIGVVKPVGVLVGFNPLTAGSLNRTGDGGFVWTLALESPEATALRVHFSDFSLPANARLYIYNVYGEAFGPYTGNGPDNGGDFWSHTVSGSVAYVQLHQFGPISASELQSTRFAISDIGFLGKKFLLPFMQQLREHSEQISQTEALCSYNEPCIEDASCYSGTAINNAKYAVAHMQWVEYPWLYYCSGGLVADTVTTSQIPYFLTANHCVSTDSTANTIEFYWQYWTSSCGGACYDPVGAVPRTLGADVLSTGTTGDYTLMQLNGNPPSGSYFMGWTSSPVANSNGTQLFRISHPSGAPQAYSKHQVDTSKPTCSGWPRGSWIYSHDLIGATEGGSSGSPVYNLSGQIVGQLSGSCGYNPEDPCDSDNNATVDGAFATYFSAVQQWLDPTTPQNEPPTANFTYTTSDLTVYFTDQSTDIDGTVVAWNWNFGDGNTSTQKNPTHTYTSSDTYTVTLTVTDDDLATDSVSKNVTVSTGGSTITLTAVGRVRWGRCYVDLTWSGATGSRVDIYRNGVRIVRTRNDGFYTNSLGRNVTGTFVYKVCETSGSVCSNEASVTFPL
jgi:hypothetical protein